MAKHCQYRILRPDHQLVLLILCCLFSLKVASQTPVQTIRGRIVDKESQAPLPGVVVVVLNTSPLLSGSTDANGQFRISAVPVGRCRLQFRLLGYAPKEMVIILASGKEAVVNTWMEEMVVEGQEVVVNGSVDRTSTNNKMTTVSSRLFSAEEAARYAGSRNDPSRMAANFAGVSGSNDSRNDIIIRGNSPLGLLWRLNGADIPNPNHFGSTGSTGGPVSILNNNTLDNSDFLTGAFPADYGNAVSGVFDLKMREGNSEKYEFLGQVGFNGFELGAEGPYRKGTNASWMVNYRYSTLQVFKALHIDFGTGAAVPQYQDITFKTDFTTTKAGKFSLWGIGGLSYVALLERDKKPGQDLFGFSARDTYFKSNVGATGLSHTILLRHNDYLRTNISLSGNYNQAMTDRIDSSFTAPNYTRPEYRQVTSNVVSGFNITYNRKINARNTFNAGFYGQLFRSHFVDSNDSKFGVNTFVTLRNYEGSTALLRGLVQWQHKLTDRLQINAGFTNQYFVLNGANAPEPRLGIRYSLPKKQSLSLGCGLHSQIQPVYLYFASAVVNGVRQETNRQLDFTRSAHAIMAYDVVLAENFRIKSELYYQYLYRVPVRNTPDAFSALNIGADFTSPNVGNLVSRGTGFNYGWELTVEKFYSRGYYVLFTSSLFESKYTGSDKVLRNTAFNGNFVMNLLGGKEFKIKGRHIISIDVRATYAGGKRYTPIDLDASRLANAEVRINDQAYAKRYPDYFRMDVKPGYRYNAKKVTHEFSVDIQNITHNENVFQQTYDILARQIKTDYQLKFFVIPQYRLLF